MALLNIRVAQVAMTAEIQDLEMVEIRMKRSRRLHYQQHQMKLTQGAQVAFAVTGNNDPQT